jgi:uncharacterized membrane protein
MAASAKRDAQAVAGALCAGLAAFMCMHGQRLCRWQSPAPVRPSGIGHRASSLPQAFPTSHNGGDHVRDALALVGVAGPRRGCVGFLLGFALGGFFDGILLHQILQWHHLLSNVDAARDMRVQILADGLFHALMYVVAAVALALLWRARTAAAEPGASGRLWGAALLGFGAWHIVDSVLSHWLLGIHRIRMDSPNPLMWDLIWFFVFGVLPALRRHARARRRQRGWRTGRGRHAGIAALLAGPIAALPGALDSTQVLVLFAPGVKGAQAFDALAKVDARVLWVDRSGGLWALRMDEPKAARRLYKGGALLVSNTGLGLGCLSWTRQRQARGRWRRSADHP